MNETLTGLNRREGGITDIILFWTIPLRDLKIQIKKLLVWGY